MRIGATGRNHLPPTLTYPTQTITNPASNKRTLQDLQYAYVLAVNVVDVVAYTAAMVGAQSHHVSEKVRFECISNFESFVNLEIPAVGDYILHES